MTEIPHVTAGEKLLAPSPRTLRLAHLDSIRFLAAIWVVISHGGLNLKPLFTGPLARALVGGFQSTFSGVSAVMVFFIISGFCIHLPYAARADVPVARFLLRRYCRIGIPLIAVLLIAPSFGARAVERLDEVTWSVYAELGYYSIYPVLFYLARRWGWTPWLGASAVGSIAVVLFDWRAMHPTELGWWVWLWGLPIWISGCLLAEAYVNGRLRPVFLSLYAWRSVAWIGGAVASYLVFHAGSPIGYPATMLVFALFAYLWLQQELQNAASAWRWLERCGAASYSIYLVHGVVLAQFDQTQAAPLALSVIRPVAVLLVAGVFYAAIEAPSHRLARYLGSPRALRRQAAMTL